LRPVHTIDRAELANQIALMQSIAENKVEHGTIRNALDDYEIRIKALEQRKQ
jgi:hypothetical protein